MEDTDQIKEAVRRKYQEIALQETTENNASCCGSACCQSNVTNIMSDDYSELKGYHADADLGLGCGLPTQFAHIRPGDTVIDLGSGAGNDCFIARAGTGETGKVIGIDFAGAMINKAKTNAGKLGFNNVEFRQGDIENIPVSDNTADVIVSNCVLNLVPNKSNVFKEIYRVLKPGGHFSISDIVIVGTLPHALKQDAEMYAGCIAGAIQKDVYLELINTIGFTDISLQQEKAITLPDDILTRYLNENELIQFNSRSSGIFSISVFAKKPAGSQCCEPVCCN